MKKILTGFTELLTLRNLDYKGPTNDDQLEIIKNGAIAIDNGIIKSIGNFNKIHKNHPNFQIEELPQKSVVIPGFIDCHTHICFAGNRKMDYALRSSGKTYLEIAQSGGGISSTVNHTRQASQSELTDLTASRIKRHLQDGVTTIEIKSGYGLTTNEELKILRAIKEASQKTAATIVPTCLAAHIKPKDFSGNNEEYLRDILQNLLPQVKAENLANRVDIFIEETAFHLDESEFYLNEAKKMGFEIAIHADQFSLGASNLAAKVQALSADHLEVSTDKEIEILAKSNTVAAMLPGSSFGLGMLNLAPARKLLDKGACVAIASDWNPGSAPMGDLLVQAAIFSACQKLSAAETLSALTFRAAKALNINNRGRLQEGYFCDLQLYPFDDYREILYNQGKIKPFAVYKEGNKVA